MKGVVAENDVCASKRYYVKVQFLPKLV